MARPLQDTRRRYKRVQTPHFFLLLARFLHKKKAHLEACTLPLPIGVPIFVAGFAADWLPWSVPHDEPLAGERSRISSRS